MRKPNRTLYSPTTRSFPASQPIQKQTRRILKENHQKQVVRKQQAQQKRTLQYRTDVRWSLHTQYGTSFALDEKAAHISERKKKRKARVYFNIDKYKKKQNIVMADPSISSPNSTLPEKLKVARKDFNVKFQRFMDSIVPFTIPRWAVFAVVLLLFYIRILWFEAFYVIAYGVSVHMLYLLVLVITPMSDPDENSNDVSLPMSEREHRPFVPKVGEFVVWRSMMKVLGIGFFLTLFSFLDIPVFWPILVFYFVTLFAVQVGGRVKHMLKHNYVPWNKPKNQFVKKEAK